MIIRDSQIDIDFRIHIRKGMKRCTHTKSDVNDDADDLVNDVRVRN